MAKVLMGLSDTVRCFVCHNLTGLLAARIVGDGLLACSRCAAHRQTLTGPGGEVELVGA